MKYVFFIGAPGSKWSSVHKNVYLSPDVDQTDFREDRTYWHSASDDGHVMHPGAFYDPGMEYGDWFDKFDQHTKEECEAELDRPFSGTGVRMIKCHVLAHHIDFIKATWPECPIVLVHRHNDSCLGWWVKQGHFTITYPNYGEYYKDLANMVLRIAEQNVDIMKAWKKYPGVSPRDNLELSAHLGLAPANDPYAVYQKYGSKKSNLRIKVI
jgi:hypothetical protein